MKRTNKKGFTLVELVVVIAILAILASVAIPVVTSIIQKARRSAAMEQATEIQQCVATCYAMTYSTLETTTISTVGQAMAHFNMDVSILADGAFVYEPNKGKVYSTLDNDKPATATSVLTSDTPVAYVAADNNGLLPDIS